MGLRRTPMLSLLYIRADEQEISFAICGDE